MEVNGSQSLPSHRVKSTAVGGRAPERTFDYEDPATQNLIPLTSPRLILYYRNFFVNQFQHGRGIF